jgi:hypothetical protein
MGKTLVSLWERVLCCVIGWSPYYGGRSEEWKLGLRIGSQEDKEKERPYSLSFSGRNKRL